VDLYVYHKNKIGDIRGIKQGNIIKGFVQIPQEELVNKLRKYIKCIPRAIEIARDNGFLDSPLRIRVV
jgi:hypothetical protein